jgi:hypothetical protein
MEWMYPDVISGLREQCLNYISGQIDITGLQRAIYDAEHKIESLEERWFRNALFEEENKLELIIYTMEVNCQRPEGLRIAERVLSQIKNAQVG